MTLRSVLFQTHVEKNSYENNVPYQQTIKLYRIDKKKVCPITENSTFCENSTANDKKNPTKNPFLL